MKIHFDQEANAAYIYLKDPPLEIGEAAWTYPCDPVRVKGMINLDFDKDDRLIGIEVLDARSRLTPDLLRQAIPCDDEGQDGASDDRGEPHLE